MSNRKLVIDLSTATENMISWIENLIKEEIDDALSSSKDEMLRALGSFQYNPEAYYMHVQNAKENSEYAGILLDSITEFCKSEKEDEKDETT